MSMPRFFRAVFIACLIGSCFAFAPPVFAACVDEDGQSCEPKDTGCTAARGYPYRGVGTCVTTGAICCSNIPPCMDGCHVGSCPAGTDAVSGVRCSAGLSCCKVKEKSSAPTKAAAPTTPQFPAATLPPLFEKRNLQDPLGDVKGITIEGLVARIISKTLPLVGALFLLLFVFGGFRYLTAGGDSKKVDSAKQTLKNAVIGIIIVIGAYLIIDVFLKILTGGATPTPKK